MSTLAPAPHGAIPTDRQLAWHELGAYGFIHFTLNTWTNLEWGMGGESPELFNPTQLDCRQWARTARDGGLQGLVLTAKHHDGFCLWPSAYTEHSVKNSPWKDGQGDVVREFTDACREYGLKVGLYLSPWDRNHAEYGRPAYVDYYRAQLRELLTGYGELFMCWFDGANGGTGWYGGANEKRSIDNETYYDWPTTIALVRELQPNACMFSDAGPDVRWVGNERGFAPARHWSAMDMTDLWPGHADRNKLLHGDPQGTQWLPAEVDVSIRPGWFWHEAENARVKSVEHLLNIYERSVGHGGCLNLNLPPDRRGLIHEHDVAALREFAEVVQATYGRDLAAGASASADRVRGGDATYGAACVLDGRADSYWAVDDWVPVGTLTLSFAAPVTLNRVLLREYVALGQRVSGFAVEWWNGLEWLVFGEGTTIGARRIVAGSTVTTERLRLRVTDARACPCIRQVSVHYLAESGLTAPTVQRNAAGAVEVIAPAGADTLRATVDGPEPTLDSPVLALPLALPMGGLVKARAWRGGVAGPTACRAFDISSAGWRVTDATPAADGFSLDSLFAHDGAGWLSRAGEGLPQYVVIDLQTTTPLSALTYTPLPGARGGIVDYAIAVSDDGATWSDPVAAGELGNLQNDPSPRRIPFASRVRARYLRLLVSRSLDGQTGIGCLQLHG